jgi:hypothetical protein
MRRSHMKRVSDKAGMASIVFDRGRNDYLCYWYNGANGGNRLLGQAHAPTASQAIDWGRARTPKVRIRMGDAKTYWAGRGAAPAGFAGVWSENSGTDKEHGLNLSEPDGGGGAAKGPACSAENP